MENPDNLKWKSDEPEKHPSEKPKVVCFCGSTRFAEWFMIKRWELEKQGVITLGINILPEGYFKGENHHGAEQEGVKHILDELHKRKIDLSDEVHVLNVDGYIGDSTRNEIEYATSIGKPVLYLERPCICPDGFCLMGHNGLNCPRNDKKNDELPSGYHICEFCGCQCCCSDQPCSCCPQKP